MFGHLQNLHLQRGRKEKKEKFECVFSVDLVFKEELNLMLEISDFLSRCGGLKLRGTDSLAKGLRIGKDPNSK